MRGSPVRMITAWTEALDDRSRSCRGTPDLRSVARSRRSRPAGTRSKDTRMSSSRRPKRPFSASCARFSRSIRSRSCLRTTSRRRPASRPSARRSRRLRKDARPCGWPRARPSGAARVSGDHGARSQARGGGVAGRRRSMHGDIDPAEARRHATGSTAEADCARPSTAWATTSTARSISSSTTRSTAFWPPRARRPARDGLARPRSRCARPSSAALAFGLAARARPVIILPRG